MNIKTFSKMAGISAYTLRYYEKLGLIVVARDQNGHRVYSGKDYKWMKCLSRLKETGMSLKDIKKFSSIRHACRDNGTDRLEILEFQQQKLNEKKKELLLSLKKIDEEIRMFKDWNGLD